MKSEHQHIEIGTQEDDDLISILYVHIISLLLFDMLALNCCTNKTSKHLPDQISRETGNDIITSKHQIRQFTINVVHKRLYDQVFG